MSVISHPLVDKVQTRRTFPEVERYRHEAAPEDAQLSVEAADEALRAVLELWGGR